jgi:hypothetical protein
VACEPSDAKRSRLGHRCPGLFPYRIAGFPFASGGKKHAGTDSETDTGGKTDCAPERVTLATVEIPGSIAEVHLR